MSLSQPAYTIIEPFSKGSGTVLYRAVRNVDHMSVILKVADPKRHRAQDRERIRNEFEIGRSLSGKVAIKPLALETYEGMPAVVLPDLGTRSLDRQLGAPMEIGRFLGLAVRIARCLEGIHKQGIIHKDLKPANILVDPVDGDVKIADFGFASLIAREHQPAPPPRLIEGSLPYISPEQTGRTNRGVDSRADLYSLGVTFYQMLAGRLPYEATDPVEWVHFHVARAATPLSEVRPEVPVAISQIVAKLLAKMPEERYQTARGLRRDLERCIEERNARGKVDPFPLGEHDASDRLQIPQNLYGRDEDVAAMLLSFQRVVRTGASELLLVSGYSGIGKTALVHELHKPVIAAHGFFAAGKFDRYKRDIPYSTFVEAFQDLVLEILAERAERLSVWRRRLLAALGVNAQLIVDVIPQVELLIGRQPPVPELPPAEMQNRFSIVFRQFIGVFAQVEHPVTLFLDDLQWADSASLGLLKDLVTHPAVHYLLVVGAYRDNEVNPAHPLMLMLDAAKREDARISNIRLGPLTHDDLTAFVSDALHTSRDEARPLAAMVQEKTNGNPFFAIQLLTTLCEQGMIKFDGRRGAWRWDLPAIRARGFTDNVVTLMVEKLQSLPAEVQEALKDVAALGHSAEIGVVSLVRGRTEDETRQDLWDAVRAGLLVRSGGITYRFLHDRVHEAVYALIPKETRPEVHLRIGRILVSLLPRTLRGDGSGGAQRIFDAVNQLNRAIRLITAPEEKALLRNLNVTAGRKARAAIAYVSARNYLAHATELLEPDAWRLRYQETFALFLELAECEYLVGSFQRADELFDYILVAVGHPQDRAKVHGLRSRLYQLAGRYDDSVAAVWEALRLLGVSIPESEDELRTATEAEMREIPVNLAGRRIADILDAPHVHDAEVGTLLTFLSEAMAPAYIARPTCLPLLTAKAVNLSLRYGNQAESCLAYSTYAVLLISIFQDIPRGQEFSEMSMRLNEQLDDHKFRGKILVIHGDHVLAWTKPFSTVFPFLARSLTASLEVGDLVWAGYLSFVITWLHFESSDPLEEVLEVSKKYEAFAKQTHNKVVYATIRLEQQFVACLQGRTRERAVFDDDTFDESAELAEVTEAAFGCGILYHHVAKQIAAFTYGLYDEALAEAEVATETLGMAMGMAIEATHPFYLCLTLTALYARVSPERQREFMARLTGLLPKLRLWADHCPENYQNRYALVSAEIARIEGRALDAERLYEEAIRTAGAHGLVHNHGLAYELASAFYRGRKMEAFADAYLLEARNCYARWGADGKVAHIDQQQPQLLERRSLAATTSFTVGMDQLDLLSVVKASQAVSSELVLDQLVRTLVRVTLEQSGAQKGCLLLCDDTAVSVVATATLLAGVVQTALVPSTPIEAYPQVPAALLQYVRLTKQYVILDDAAADAGRFASDPYLRHKKPRSVLGLPILRRADVRGLLYLENNLMAGAFTPERLTALELVAAQSAISMENALLLSKEQAARAAAEEAEHRLAFLDKVSAILAQSLDFEDTIARLGRLCVGIVADWCMIDVLIAPESIRRLAGAHVDPKKQELLDELGRRYPPRWDSQRPAPHVFRSGQSMVFPEISEDLLRQYTEDEDHARLVRELGTRTAMSVPLVARGQTFGVFTLASGQPGRHYGATDLELAQEIARRASFAIDNARLYHLAQDAIRVRDEFLSTASHELRTPVTSVSLVIQSLLRGARSEGPSVPLPTLLLAEQQTQRLTALIEQLLDVTRIQAGRLMLVLDSFDLVAEVRRILVRMQPQIDQAESSVTLDAPESLVVRWDRSRIDQLVTNLVGNALTYGGKQPIEVTVARTTDGVLLVVRDHGIGIAQDRLGYIFERFARAASARHYGGLGLGLFIARQIVAAHHGTIRVDSELGRGSSFIVELPLQVTEEGSS
jgi:predicted ATPase/signal transduction histidine kinase/tRNA A-37 threonylcarbamoyl transferase component Bud32